MPLKSQSDCLKLQADIDAAAESEEDWLMAFHPDKCNVLSVTTTQTSTFTTQLHSSQSYCRNCYICYVLRHNITIKPKIGQTHR